MRLRVLPWALVVCLGLACRGGTPGFDQEQGEFVMPDVVIVGGERQSGEIEPADCPNGFVYASEIERVENCDEPQPVVERLCQAAERHAMAVAEAVQCASALCPERAISRRFRGWSCGGNPTPVVVTCGVEIEVVCWGLF